MNRKIKIRNNVLLIFVILFSISPEMFSQDKQKEKKYLFVDTVDRALDISNFLDYPYGFVPNPIIITEPAVGYGGGLGLLFIRKKKKTTKERDVPIVTGVVGGATQNKTWFAGGFHFHTWKDDRIRYMGALFKTNVNIKYYGDGEGLLGNLIKNPVQYNMNAWLLFQRMQFRVANSNFFMGFQYIFYRTVNSLDTLPDKPLINKILKKFTGTSVISAITLINKYDSRNNIFTPTKGILGGWNISYNPEFLGGSDNFGRTSLYFLGYFPLLKRLNSAWRFDYKYAFGDVPFYSKPFLDMRGAPVMKYQGNNTLELAAEFTFNIYHRWYLDAFGGSGWAYPSFDELSGTTTVVNYGAGIRYLIAKRYGILMGIDFAWTNQGDFAFYIVFGGVWRY